jgi:hypothetical protein
MPLRVKRVRVELERSRVLAVGVSHAAPLVFKVTRMVSNRSAQLAPVRTGALRASRRMTMRARPQSVTGTVSYTRKYATWVHEGTPPHVIRPKRKRYLSFYWPKVGHRVVFRYVSHPGTKGQPFLRQALQEIAPAEGFLVTTGFTTLTDLA